MVVAFVVLSRGAFVFIKEGSTEQPYQQLQLQVTVKNESIFLKT